MKRILMWRLLLGVAATSTSALGQAYTICTPGSLPGWTCTLPAAGCYGMAKLCYCDGHCIETPCYYVFGTPMIVRNESCAAGGPSPLDQQCKPKTQVGDPVDITSGAGIVTRTDLSISTPVGPLEFSRILNTTRMNWFLKEPPLRDLPKLFGEKSVADGGLTDSEAPYWSLNWTAAVKPSPSSYNVTVASVDGSQYSFGWNASQCTAGQTTPTLLSPYSGAKIGAEFFCLNNQEYLLLKPDGTQEHYASPAGTGAIFLTHVYAANSQLLATVTYGPPRDATAVALTGCPAGGTGSVPYIQSVTSPSGVVDFRYAHAGAECALTGLWLGSSGASLSQVVAYTFGPGVAPLASATRLSGSVVTAKESYSVVEEQLQLDGGILSFVGTELLPSNAVLRENYRFIIPSFSLFTTSATTPQGVFTLFNDGGVQDVEFLSREVGDFSASRTSRHEVYTLALDSDTQAPRRSLMTITCGLTQSCSPGTEYTSQTSISGQNVTLVTPPVVGAARVSSRYPGPLLVDGGLSSAWLLSSFHNGVDGGVSLTNLGTPGNCKGLECEWYSYTRVANNNAIRPATTTRPSVVTAGQNVTITKAYYSNGDLSSELTAGYSKGITGTAPVVPSSTAVQRYIGTFSFKTRSSGGNCTSGTDTLGRVVEVHGPCDVSGPTATDCPGTSFPIRQLVYNDNLPVNVADRLRLAQTKSFPNGCAGVALTVSYSSYDDFGRPGTVVDENGVSTSFVYDREGHVTQRSVVTSGGTRTWNFRYVAERLRAVQYPEGNALRYCYTPGADLTLSSFNCVEGAAGELDEPTAVVRAASFTGATAWSEGVAYTYETDTKNASKASYYSVTSGSSSLRRTTSMTHDAQDRLTGTQDGLSSSVGRQRYYADTLRSAVGFAFNAAPAFCWNTATSSVSTQCTSFEYDDALRLSRVATPLADGTTIETKLLSNSNGDLCDISGGSSTLSCDTTVSRTNGLSASYEYDDFGNVLAAWVPGSISGALKGGTQYRYDALGDVVVRQSSQQQTTLTSTTFTWDNMGRPLTVVASSASPQTLYSWTYDTAGTPCSDAQTFVKGRVSSATSPLGVTYFSYDEFGRKLKERLVRPSGTACTDADGTLKTVSTYSPNGNLLTLTYPHGMVVQYNYGTVLELKDRIDSVAVSVDGTTATRTLVSGVTWEPFGGLRYYGITAGNAGPIAVEQVLGDTSFVPAQADACPTMAVASANSQLTGRPSALFVSTNALGQGAGTGTVYKERFAWTADQLTTRTTCLANANATATVESFAYDRALRLTGATAPQRATAGGAYFAEGYTFDGRGNRLTYAINGSGQSEALTYLGGLGPDRLTQVAGNGVGTLIQRTYGYDADGRVTSITWPVDSSGQPSQKYTLGYLQAGGVTDSAVKQIAVGQGAASLTYDYVFDADNRRRAKVYPTGLRDEYFWAAGWQMLEDRGLRTSGYSVDEYLWLGGQPIGVRRSAFSAAWARLAQTTTNCTRTGEYVTKGCGWRHLVSNVTGRVVLAVDDAQAIAGVYESQPSGHANRQNWWGETPHPYGASTTYTLATVNQPVRGLSEAMRLRFGVVDLEPGLDTLKVKNSAGTQLWSASAWHSSTLSTSWLTTTTNSALTATVVTNSCNGPPDGGVCSGYAYQGVTLESVDYLRWQSTSKPWELALRQPGQYYDAETGLFENWNRFYDADTGRYLSPEPLLQPRNLADDPELLTLPAPLRQAISQMSSGPGFAAAQAKLGRSVPAYAYALNNPLAFVDPDGLAATREDFCRETGQCIPDYCVQNPEVCNSPPPNKCEDPKAQGIITCPGKCSIYGGLAYLACKAAGGEKCALFAYKVFTGCMKTCLPELPN